LFLSFSKAALGDYIQKKPVFTKPSFSNTAVTFVGFLGLFTKPFSLLYNLSKNGLWWRGESIKKVL